MKNLVFISGLLFHSLIFSQSVVVEKTHYGIRDAAGNGLDCNNLQLTNIVIEDGYMIVTLLNTCDNCAAGEDGFQFGELLAVSTLPPFDTIAGTFCNCHISPENNSSESYLLELTGEIIPLFEDLQIIFIGFCDSLSLDQNQSLTHISDNNFTVYPNPGAGNINIRYEDIKPEYLEIFDYTGKLIIKQHLGSSEINISGTDPGVYILKFTADNKTRYLRYLKF